MCIRDSFCSGQEETEGRQGLYGVRLAVKESICRKSVYTNQLIDERLMSMRFELTGECAAVNLVVAYAPSCCLCPNVSQPERRAEIGLLEEVGALG